MNIPVQVETAVRSHDRTVRMRGRGPKAELRPVKNERVGKKDGKEVAWDDIVKGYGYEKEKNVVLADDDLETAVLATSKTFAIEDFTSEAQVDPRFNEKPNYRVPKRGRERA